MYIKTDTPLLFNSYATFRYINSYATLRYINSYATLRYNNSYATFRYNNSIYFYDIATNAKWHNYSVHLAYSFPRDLSASWEFNNP